MTKILRYALDDVDEQTIDLPPRSEILSVIKQHDKVMLYVSVDEFVPLEERCIPGLERPPEHFGRRQRFWQWFWSW